MPLMLFRLHSLKNYKAGRGDGTRGTNQVLSLDSPSSEGFDTDVIELR